MNKLEKIFFFVISPILTLPLTLYGIYKKSTFNLMLLSISCGILSFMYVPHITNDKVRYFELYQDFSKFGYGYFLKYLSQGRPDFILHGLVFLFAKIQIPFSFLLLLITTFTVAVYFYVFHKFSKFYSNSFYFVFFILVFLSFSLPDLLSGIRFYFGSAFLLLGFQKGLIEKERVKGGMLLLLAIFTHFSFALFFPVYMLILFFPKNYKLYVGIMVASFLFILVPKTIIISIADTFGVTMFEDKTNVYLGGEDFIEKGINEGSRNYIWVYLISIGWSFFAYIYLLFTLFRKSLIRNIVYCSFAFINIFFTITTVYARYLIVVKFLFILLLIYEYFTSRKIKPILIMILFMLVNFVSNIIVMRYSIIESYFNTNILTIINVFFRDDMNFNDFLR